jgi:hypothetical protein
VVGHQRVGLDAFPPLDVEEGPVETLFPAIADFKRVVAVPVERVRLG